MRVNMLENIISFFKKMLGAEQKTEKSKNAAKERLHLVLIQDRASVSADFLDAMKQEIIDVIKKYIEIDENAIDVRLTNKTNEDGTNGAPALYANIPITNVKPTAIKKDSEEKQETQNKENLKEENKKEETEQNKEEKLEKEEKTEIPAEVIETEAPNNK